MVRGIWIHEDRQRDGERALGWIKPRCGHANLYWGHKTHVKQIDTRCARCGRRVRFNPNKRDRRGKIRQAIWITRSKDTREEIERKVRYLNEISSGNDGGRSPGFLTASELMKEKNARLMGGDSDSDNA